MLVTAGPTREAIDPVRFITNHSSGKMGYAVAAAARSAGAAVTLVSGPTQLAAPAGVERVGSNGTAMPSAPPTSRVVSLTAEPTPALAGGNEATMAAVAGGDPAEAGSGEKIAVKLALAATEFHQQPLVQNFYLAVAEKAADV